MSGSSSAAETFFLYALQLCGAFITCPWYSWCWIITCPAIDEHDTSLDGGAVFGSQSHVRALMGMAVHSSMKAMHAIPRAGQAPTTVMVGGLLSIAARQCTLEIVTSWSAG